jgi:uncharacterized protein (TIGR02145 family)
MKTKIYFFALTILSLFDLQAQTIMNIHQSNGTVLQIPLNTIDSITYTINNSGQLATISTLSISNISSNSANSGGNITNNGGTSVTQRGVVWSTSPNPTTANNLTSDGNGIGNFTSALIGLNANTTYYVRAYATNSAGTAYGNELSFTTTSLIGSLSSLNCSGSTNNGVLTAGIVASGVSSIIPYSGGNGGAFIAQSINSTGVTGLIASIPAGILANGNGSLTFTITGLPSGTGTANFSINIGGQNCTLSRSVTGGGGIVTNPGTGVIFDGYNYSSFVLGNGQEWMAENLRTTTYANGDPIPNEIDDNQWSTVITGVWGHYNNDSQYENPYGKLYNGYAVADTRNVCPTGWHVPSDAEWSTFINYLDPNADGGNNFNTSGGKMKSTGTQYWQSPNTGATNESGFSGLPGADRYINGPSGNIGYNGSWWSSTVVPPVYANVYGVDFNTGTVYKNNYNKMHGRSIRCIKD